VYDDTIFWRRLSFVWIGGGLLLWHTCPHFFSGHSPGSSIQLPVVFGGLDLALVVNVAIIFWLLLDVLGDLFMTGVCW